jgi:Zn finger protein HypA/HybF involved in hydrogenase expression
MVMTVRIPLQTGGAVFQDKVLLGATGLVLLILAGAGWSLFGGQAKYVDGQPVYTHMHCSTCLEEMPYVARLAGTDCPACGQGAVYVPTFGSVKEGSASGPLGARIVVFFVLAAVLVQGLIYLAARRIRSLGEAQEKIRLELLICRCPYCQRKIGYPAFKAGNGGVCPRCKTGFTFPEHSG